MYLDILYYTVPCYTVLYCTWLFFTILYLDILYYTVPGYTVLYLALLYYTVP